MEEWKKILSGDYEVSSEGRVKRVTAASGTQAGKILRPIVVTGSKGKYPYHQITLSVGSVRRSFKLHRLVALAFLGPQPDGAHVNHKDGNTFNNCVSNLEYVTPLENAQHASNLGLLVRGEEHDSAKLTEDQVEEIRRRYYIENATIRELASDYGLTVGTVHPLIKFKTWRHVPSKYAHLVKDVHYGARKKGKITEHEVREIRRLVSEGTSYRKIQEQFGINPSTINALISGKTWKHVTRRNPR